MQLGEKVVGRAEYIRGRFNTVSWNVQTRLQNAQPFARIAYRITRIFALTLRYFLFSELIAVLEMLAWFIANCVFALQNRAAAGWVFGSSQQGKQERAKEDEVGFGQIVPLLLLMLPLMTFVGTWHGRFGVFSRFFFWRRIEANMG